MGLEGETGGTKLEVKRQHRRSNNAEADAIAQLEDQGWTVYTRGWPDLLCTKGTEIRFVEVKPMGRRLSRFQEAVAEALKSCLGITVELWESELFGTTPRGRPPLSDIRDILSKGKVVVRKHKQRIFVVAPFSQKFVDGARVLGGRYRPGMRGWSFKANREPGLMTLIQQVYGRNSYPYETDDSYGRGQDKNG